ncbi:MAG: DUF2905 domain-containing protein [Actinomycetota bacterium]|nr:DUF2905 domain-containing protein [Actinomycetota bacterium]
MELSSLGRVLVVVGAVIVALGLLLVLGGGLGLGRLPVDIAIRRGNTRIYIPLATCLLLSLVVTLILSLLSRR